MSVGVCVINRNGIALAADSAGTFTGNKMFYNSMNKVFKREGLLNCEPIVFENGLIADYCKSVDSEYLIRGLRNTSDYMYEENIAKINQEINPRLKTVYFRADNEIISSSMVRELMAFNKNVDKYVPKEIASLF